MKLNNRRNFATVIDANNYIYVIGGFDNNNIPLKTVEFIDLNFSKLGWNLLNYSLNEYRTDFSATISNYGYIYAIGGYDPSNNKYLDTVEIFDFE